MNITIVVSGAIFLSLVFHFIGVKAGAKKTVWLMLVLAWAGTINVAMSEIKSKGYEDIREMQGKFADTDRLIEEAKPEISLYEMIGIKKSYQINSHKK